MGRSTWIAEALVAAADDLRGEVGGMVFAEPVFHVYNPLAYAWEVHEAYLRRAAPEDPGGVVFLGMNPGPWGMAQTGVPFGEVSAVRDWMALTGAVASPRAQHDRRPIEGFECHRSEVSGRRLWGLVAERFGTLGAFAERHIVMNYCPLVFMEESGKNRTPDRLPARERAPLEEACDRHLRRVFEAIQPEWIVGVGAFAEKQARRVVGSTRDPESAAPRIGRILHPSPASPAANRGWAEQAVAQMEAMGVW